MAALRYGGPSLRWAGTAVRDSTYRYRLRPYMHDIQILDETDGGLSACIGLTNDWGSPNI
jgi:hypothetical protein